MNDGYDKKAEARLLSRRSVEPSTGCWLYSGALTGNGYGHISYRGEAEYTHRVAGVLFLGLELTSGEFVLHRCDTPACFNPDHLFIGTQQENMRDAAQKGRMTGKKLDADEVRKIKYLLGGGSTYRELARSFNVSTTAIGQIARGETWKTVSLRQDNENAEHADLDQDAPDKVSI
jgi:hypothetical protein